MTAVSRARLFREATAETDSGGTVVYRVQLDGRAVGWVGDHRPWLGHRYGGRRWWAVWREDGDTVARWNTFTEAPNLMTRFAAVEALVHQIRTTQEGGRS